jgi:ADP-ribose pyrophosphatase YjhB (NUDIX family)
MKNFEFEYKNNKYWYSRSVAVVGIIQAHDTNWRWHVLATKRGKNTPDYQGYWCLPCGYVDFNETCEEAIKREVFEETGCNINISKLNLIGIDSIPEGRQNITIQYEHIYHQEFINTLKLTNKNADNGEVDEIKFIKISNIDDYDWAFNHNHLLKKYFKI